MAELIAEATSTGTLDKRDADYATAQGASSAGTVTNGASTWDIGQYYGQSVVGGSPGYLVWRNGLIFDISSISSSKTILTAILSLMPWRNGIDTPHNNFDVVVVSGSDLADTLVVEDYGDLLDDITSFGSLSTASMVLESYNTITLNATAVAAIQAALSSGTVRFGVRSDNDISATTPKLGGGSLYDEVAGFYGSTADKKPKLTVTYVFIPKVIII